jgi:hypothetical protein
MSALTDGVGEQQPHRAGLAEGMLEFGVAQCRIDGDQDQPGQCGAVLEDDPLGDVGAQTAMYSPGANRAASQDGVLCVV